VPAAIERVEGEDVRLHWRPRAAILSATPRSDPLSSRATPGSRSTGPGGLPGSSIRSANRHIE
jgi:hypothetical protein